MELFSRKENIVIKGIKEKTDENCKEIFHDFLQDILEINDTKTRIKVVYAHRIGKSKPGSNRLLLARLLYFPHKQEIMSKTKNLYKSDEMKKREATENYEKNIWINNDYPESIRQARQILYPVVKLARNVDENAFMVNDAIQFQGKKYTINNIHKINLNIAGLHSTYTGDSVYFFGRFSPFSNFYPVTLSIDGRQYSSTEQYYQYCKAVYSKEKAIGEKILVTDDPRVIKSLGDQVKSDSWYGNESNKAMWRALHAKFTIPFFKDILKGAEQRRLVETNKSDFYWSCGLQGKDPAVNSERLWKSQNMLGKMLQDIRSQI